MQSNKQSNSPFYQNQTKINFIKVLIEKYENKFTYENNLMIGSNQSLISLIIKHLQSLKAKLNELENTKVTPQNEITINQIKETVKKELSSLNKKSLRLINLELFLFSLDTRKKISNSTFSKSFNRLRSRRKFITDEEHRLSKLLIAS